MPPSWNTCMLTLEALSLALLLFKFSLMCTDLRGDKRWSSTILYLTEAETLAISLWFSLLILCSVRRTGTCSDFWTYWTNYKATPQHPVHCRNTLYRSPSSVQIWQSTAFWIVFSFCFSIKNCQKIAMNESGFVRRVIVHSQLFNYFDYLLELGENLTACHRQC